MTQDGCVPDVFAWRVVKVPTPTGVVAAGRMTQDGCVPDVFAWRVVKVPTLAGVVVAGRMIHNEIPFSKKLPPSPNLLPGICVCIYEGTLSATQPTRY